MVGRNEESNEQRSAQGKDMKIRNGDTHTRHRNTGSLASSSTAEYHLESDAVPRSHALIYSSCLPENPVTLIYCILLPVTFDFPYLFSLRALLSLCIYIYVTLNVFLGVHKKTSMATGFHMHAVVMPTKYVFPSVRNFLA